MFKISRFFLALLCMLALPSVSMATVLLPHSQATLGEELIGVVALEYSDCGAGISNCDTVQFDITNSTSTAWTDYHIRIDRAGTSAVNPFFNFNLLSSDAVLDTYTHTIADQVDLLFAVGDSLMFGESMSFTFQYTDQDDMFGHLFYGTPTYGDGTTPGVSVPEPSVVALIGLGLLGFLVTRRRIQK